MVDIVVSQAVTIRSDPRPGDMGWVVHRHGILYRQEFDWDWRFEGVVAEIVGEIVGNFDPRRARCWFAEAEGRVVGCIFLVPKTDDVAKLRLMLVEPEWRGRGLGGRLIDECLTFALTAGYRTVTLWTNDPLVAARRLYARAGFRMVRSEPADLFGHRMVSETWELDLVGWEPAAGSKR